MFDAMRLPNEYDPDVASDEASLYIDPEEDRAVQSFKDEADINVLVRRIGLTGEMPPPRPGAQYGDFSEVVDFSSAMQAVASAKSAFMELPARVRAQFDNSPAQLLSFVHSDDPRDIEDAVEMGLIPPRPPVVPEAPPEPDPGS